MTYDKYIISYNIINYQLIIYEKYTIIMVIALEVSDLLKLTKSSMKSGNYDMIPTIKNRVSKRKYGLSQFDIEDYIGSLEEEDLFKGPEPDRDCPKEELFIFKKEIMPDVIFYTKLKYKNNQIKILSCHEDE